MSRPRKPTKIQCHFAVSLFRCFAEVPICPNIKGHAAPRSSGTLALPSFGPWQDFRHTHLTLCNLCLKETHHSSSLIFSYRDWTQNSRSLLSQTYPGTHAAYQHCFDFHLRTGAEISVDQHRVSLKQWLIDVLRILTRKQGKMNGALSRRHPHTKPTTCKK